MCIAEFNRDVAPLDVTEVTQSLTEALCMYRLPSVLQITYSRNPGRVWG